jgi:hypothetical protein
MFRQSPFRQSPHSFAARLLLPVTLFLVQAPLTPWVARADEPAAADAPSPADAPATDAIPTNPPADLARLFPPSTVAYVELRRADDLLRHALDPAAMELLGRFGPIKQAKDSGQLAQLQLVAGLLENRMEMKWPEIIRQLTDKGARLAIDPAGGPLIAFQAHSPEFLAKLDKEVGDLIGTFAQIGGQPSPVKHEEYKGVKTTALSATEVHAIVGDLLLVANQPATLHAAIDRWQDPANKTLAEAADYQQARAAVAADDPTAWAVARLDAVRSLPQMQQLLESGRGNPVIEFAVGGVIDALKSAPYSAASLRVDGQSGSLRLHVPRDAAQLASSRAWFFAPTGGQAAAPLKANGQIGTLTTYRDLGALWAAREELFNEQIVAGLAQADSGLGLFFTGRDFGPEVLGQLGPRIQLVVAEQQFADGVPQPGIRLPAEALVFELKDPAEMSLPLLIAYQKTVGLLNIVGGQQGQPAMLLTSEEHHGIHISTATFVADKHTPLTDAPLQYNFSPSCATVGNRWVLGSTAAIVRDLVDRLRASDALPPTADNTLLNVDLRGVVAALNANRDWFISRDMLTNGRAREEAAAQIDAIYQLLGALNVGTLRLTDAPTALDLTLTVGHSQ